MIENIFSQYNLWETLEHYEAELEQNQDEYKGNKIQFFISSALERNCTVTP